MDSVWILYGFCLQNPSESVRKFVLSQGMFWMALWIVDQLLTNKHWKNILIIYIYGLYIKVCMYVCTNSERILHLFCADSARILSGFCADSVQILCKF